MSAQLREEVRRFRLAATCEECRHFVASVERCDVLYPITPHRKRAFDEAGDGDRVWFCKMFEAL